MSLIYELRVDYGVNTMLLVPITRNAVDQMIPIAIKAAKDAGMTKWAKALEDKRVAWTALRSHLEAIEQRCQIVLANLIGYLNSTTKRVEYDQTHMVGHYAQGIQKVVEVIAAIHSYRNKAIYDERQVA